MLFSYEEKLTKFGIVDPNFSHNGRELIKIFVKKTFHNMKTIIESILKSEREEKAVNTGDNILITNGPYDLFKLIFSIFDIFKKENFKIKFIVEQFLSLTKECIIQYILGADCVISRTDQDIDMEFLIAIANNSNKINTQYEELIDQIKTMKILNDEEVDEAASRREIISLVMLTSMNAIVRFVTDLSEELLIKFQENFMTLDISNVLEITFTTYGKFIRYMQHSIQKKTWAEIVKSIVFNYIKSLLTTAGKKIKKIEDLTSKIRNDKSEILDAFKEVAGENLTQETLKILDDFINFLEISPDMISLSCSKIREFNGPQFSISTVKALINLRCDLSKEEKNDAINSCKIVLDNFSHEEGATSSFTTKNSALLENLEREINIKEQLEREEENKEKVLEGIEDSIKTKKRRTMTLTEFLNIDGLDETDLDINPEDEDMNAKIAHLPTRKSLAEFYADPNANRDTDIIYSGKMLKKSSSTYQERFFQLKNGHLYWYKSNYSKEAQNHIPVTEMKKIEAFKSCKFKIIGFDKEYKFQCKSEEEKEAWMNALNKEIKRIRGDSLKKLDNVYEVKLKKKVIVDYYNLPNIYAEKLYMKKRVDDAMRTENNFLSKDKKK